MLKTTTSVVDRRVVVTSEFNTHPFEAGWASEGIYFVQRSAVDGAPMSVLTLQPQVSPDGIHWIDRGTPAVIEPASEIGAVEVRWFGNWTRVRITGASDEQPSLVTVHLNLKG